MKIYISCDMEGIAGVVDWPQTEGESDYMSRFRHLMTAEANAAALGAFDGGADEVVVNDAHDYMRNIVLENLDPRVELISGGRKPFSMMAGIDETFDKVFLIGYHARAGTHAGTLDHTMTSRIHHVWVNGVELSEGGLNALLAGAYGIPVVLVTGDEASVAQAQHLFGPVESVVTKRALSRTSAVCRHPRLVQDETRKAARKAAGVTRQPWTLDSPYLLQVEFQTSSEADAAGVLPGAERIEAYTVRWQGEEYREVYRAFLCMCTLSRP